MAKSDLAIRRHIFLICSDFWSQIWMDNVIKIAWIKIIRAEMKCEKQTAMVDTVGTDWNVLGPRNPHFFGLCWKTVAKSWLRGLSSKIDSLLLFPNGNRHSRTGSLFHTIASVKLIFVIYHSFSYTFRPFTFTSLNTSDRIFGVLFRWFLNVVWCPLYGSNQ
jgi:hypothetical protein